MIALTAETVRLQVRAKTKEEAIRAAADVLADAGFIDAAYAESMFGREQQANTYLGNGIAIPHGMAKDRELIHRTGVSVVQLAEGVTWKDRETAWLIVGIAARSDEHLGILAALTDVLDDAELTARLAKTSDVNEIVSALTRQKDATVSDATSDASASHVEVQIAGTAGLHARPATFFVDIAAPFDAEIRVEHNGRSANGKAMASLLKLGVPGGATIRISATGPDAALALEALRDAVESGLADHEEEKIVAGPTWTPESQGRAILGLSASPGLVIAPLRLYHATKVVIHHEFAADAQEERHRFDQAVETAREQLEELYESVRKRAGANQASIFRAHQAMLRDEDLRRAVLGGIDEGLSAARAWQRELELRVAELQQVKNERMAERAADLHDVSERVLRILGGTEDAPGGDDAPATPVILVADDLTPSDTAKLDPRLILGLCTASGGPTSHTAIIARSLDIPAVVGAGPAVLELTDGQVVILDGGGGRIYVEPDDADLASAERFRVQLHSQRDIEFDRRFEPAILRDGHRVEVVANIGKAAEATQAVDAGAEGVGLMRTEFLFLDRDTAPTEDEQYEAYSTMTRALNGLPLIIRTLDIGGDKVVPYLALPHEENPFLGVRGIRLCLRKPELFLPQLRAIYRAAETGPIKIMFPMIATLEDLRAGREVAESVRRELGAPEVEIGIMIEVPSAVLIAPELAREVAFFSIGTNDLTQYVLAIDRMHPTLGNQVDALHPAVLRMIDLTVRAATPAGKWVGVCGGMAGDPLGALILTGLGVTELSMSIPSIAGVKASLRGYTSRQAKAFAQKALACGTAQEVRELPLP